MPNKQDIEYQFAAKSYPQSKLLRLVPWFDVFFGSRHDFFIDDSNWGFILSGTLHASNFIAV